MSADAQVYVDLNRERKARKLAAVLAPVLEAAQCDLSILDRQAWELACRRAGIDPVKQFPSHETMSLVALEIEQLKQLGGGAASSPSPEVATPSERPPSEAASTPSENSPAPSVNGVRQASEGEPAASTVSRGRVNTTPFRDPCSPTLFDLPEARETTAQAIQRVGDHADPDWKIRALEAVRAVAERQTHFIVDDCWRFVEEPREPRAMGAVIAKARKQGLIAPTSEYRPSARVTAHSNPRRVWKSLICRAVSV